MRYDITDHPLLSEKAQALAEGENGEEALQAQIELAEVYLGLATGTLFTGTQAVLIQHFLTLQVNWQVELGIEPFYIRSISSTHSEQTTTYKDQPIIHPAVQLGFMALLKTWGYRRTVRSLR